MKKYLLSFFFVSFFFSCVSPAFAAVIGLNDIAYTLLFGSRRNGEGNFYNEDADAICKSQGPGWFRVKPHPNLSCQSKTVPIKIKKTDSNGNETISEGPDTTTCYHSCMCDTSKFPYKEAEVNDNIYFKVANDAEECQDPEDDVIYVSDIECDPDNATALISMYDDFFNTTEAAKTFEGASKSKTCYAFDMFKCYNGREVDVAKLTPVNNLALDDSGGTKGLFTVDDDPLLQYDVALSRSYYTLRGGTSGVACAYGAKIPNKISIPDGWGGSKQVQNPAFVGSATKMCASTKLGKAIYYPSFEYFYYNGDCMEKKGCGTDNMANTNITAEDFIAYYKDSNTISEESCPMETGCKTTSSATGGTVCSISTSWGAWMDSKTPTGEVCQTLPTCKSLGYVFTEAQCQQYGLDYIHCPMDSTKVYCSMIKVPDNCAVGMRYYAVNSTCDNYYNGEIVVSVEEKNGLKYIETVDKTRPIEVLTNANVDTDGDKPVLSIDTSTITNGVELRIEAEKYCASLGYDQSLPSGKDLEEVAKLYGGLKSFGSGSLCTERNCSAKLLTTDGFIDKDATNGSTIEKYQITVDNYMMLCKKTYPMRIYTEPECVVRGYETSEPEGLICREVPLDNGLTCYTDCREKTCADIKGKIDDKVGVSVKPTGLTCTSTNVNGLTCYTDCYNRDCSDTNASYVDEVPDGQTCEPVTTVDGKTCYYNCKDVQEIEHGCQVGLYFDTVCNMCTNTKSQYLVVAVEDDRKTIVTIDTLTGTNAPGKTCTGQRVGNVRQCGITTCGAHSTWLTPDEYRVYGSSLTGAGDGSTGGSLCWLASGGDNASIYNAGYGNIIELTSSQLDYTAANTEGTELSDCTNDGGAVAASIMCKVTFTNTTVNPACIDEPEEDPDCQAGMYFDTVYNRCTNTKGQYLIVAVEDDGKTIVTIDTQTGTNAPGKTCTGQRVGNVRQCGITTCGAHATWLTADEYREYGSSLTGAGDGTTGGSLCWLASGGNNASIYNPGNGNIIELTSSQLDYTAASTEGTELSDCTNDGGLVAASIMCKVTFTKE